MPVAAASIQIRYRRTDTVGQWTHRTIDPGQSSVVLTDVERGVSYDIEARAISASGSASAWVQQTHVVAALVMQPLAATSLAATSLADGVHLTWAASDVQRSDVEYEIQRTGDISGAPDTAHWATLNLVRSLRYTDGVTDGVVRWYRVRAATYGGITTSFSSNVSSRGKTVADGATAGATIGPGGNVTGAVDSNGRAIVDLSQSHLNKNLDNVGDGSTFKRLANVNADNTLHVSSSLNPQGSVLPNQVVLITFQMPDATTIIASWLAQTLLRADSTNLNLLSSAGSTLLTNGDGESGTVGSAEPSWTLGSGNSLITANDFVHSGSKSMKITNPSTANSFSNQNVSLTAGQIYVLEGWIKTDALATFANAGGLLNVQIVSGITSFTIITKFGAYDSGSTTLPTVGLPADGTARGYTFVQCYFKPTASGVISILCQNLSFGGSVWFDDVKVYPFSGAAYSGLSASTGYYIYQYIDVPTSSIKFANGTPPGTSPSDTTAMQCAIDGRIQIPMKKVTTPASGGTGSDTGGGSGTCTEFSEPVTIRRYSWDTGELLFEGQVKAGEVAHGSESEKENDPPMRGDFIQGHSFTQGADVYRAVQSIKHVPCAGWMIIDGHRFTACESVHENGAWMPAWKVPGANQDNLPSHKVQIEVEADDFDEHNYYVGDRLVHNYVLPC